MLDEEYQPQQIPDYGARAQPALVERMAPQLRLTQAGNGAAVLAVVSSVAALVTYPDFGGASRGSTWAVAATVISVVMLAITSFQHLAWRRAMAEWRGEKDYDLRGLTRISWVLHLVSYLAAFLGLWACIAGSVAAGTSSTPAVLLALVLLFTLAAQVMAGVQYLRISGPSGTIPGHLRRLHQAIQRQR